MKLSILILTHNRPTLFTRCLKSVIDTVDGDIEIIVNNDSSDITEIDHRQIQYHYKKFDNLSSIYKFLLDKSTGEYVYYLEDDDYLVPNFNFSLTADLVVGNYMPTYNPAFKLAAMTYYSNGYHSTSDFKKIINFDLLQLSQFIFKRSTIMDFNFPMDNNIHNDINLVLHSCSNSKSVQTMNKVLFFQTQDGGDNISFPETTSSVNTVKHLEFLDNYEIFKTASYTARS